MIHGRENIEVDLEPDLGTPKSKAAFSTGKLSSQSKKNLQEEVNATDNYTDNKEYVSNNGSRLESKLTNSDRQFILKQWVQTSSKAPPNTYDPKMDPSSPVNITHNTVNDNVVNYLKKKKIGENKRNNFENNMKVFQHTKAYVNPEALMSNLSIHFKNNLKNQQSLNRKKEQESKMKINQTFNMDSYPYSPLPKNVNDLIKRSKTIIAESFNNEIFDNEA